MPGSDKHACALLHSNANVPCLNLSVQDALHSLDAPILTRMTLTCTTLDVRGHQTLTPYVAAQVLKLSIRCHQAARRPSSSTSSSSYHHRDSHSSTRCRPAALCPSSSTSSSYRRRGSHNISLRLCSRALTQHISEVICGWCRSTCAELGVVEGQMLVMGRWLSLCI